MVKKRAIKEAGEGQKESAAEKNETMRAEQRIEILDSRKERFLRLFKSKNKIGLVFLVGLLVILIFTLNVRTSNIPYLKDVTTGSYTLGPDLDPFLFLRWAKYIVQHGSLMEHDTMRYLPVEYDTAYETTFVSYMIAQMYNILHSINPGITVEFVAIIYPVIFFLLAAAAFFFFVRRIFAFCPEVKRNIIALIATAFFVNMPSLVHRTVAGIPEKEAAGIFFMFLSFYLFLVGFQSKSKRNAVIFGVLSGIATGLLGLTWGGVSYVFIVASLSMLAYFFLRNVSMENYLAFVSWILSFTFVLSVFTGKYNGVVGLIESTTTSQLAFIGLLLISADMFITPRIYRKRNIKLPKIVFSCIISFAAVFVVLMLINPALVFNYIAILQDQLLHPIGTDRLTLTVAENNQPYFDVWRDTFGIWFFWLFFAASVLLFYEAVQKLKKSERYILAAAFAVFLICLIFSRYGPSATMNGTGALSQFVYFGGYILFGLVFIAIYFNAYKSGEIGKFRQINKEIIFLLVMFFVAAVSARGAIRLFFILAPITAILVSFIAVDLSERALRSRNELVKSVFWISIILAFIGFYMVSPSQVMIMSIFILAITSRITVAFVKKEEDLIRIMLWIVAVFIIISIMIPSFNSFSSATAGEARGTVPGYYQVQWQKAMAWVRENTPEGSIFSHWWDYGYWIQSIGERPTFLDGGNAYGYWNHLVGRYVLTGKNEIEALQVLKAHNASYLLIDSTDIGKYPAYSSIGSDLNYDRYNWVPTFTLDESQTRETRNETLLFYPGGTLFSREFVWYDQSSHEQYLLPAENQDAIIAGVVLPVKEIEVSLFNFTTARQPTAIVLYKRNKRIEIPMCYLYFGKFYDFKDNGPCLPAALYVMPKISQSGAGSVSVNNFGASLFLNQKAIEALWVRLYLFGEGENFELVHSEPHPIIEQLNNQGLNLPEFAFFGQVLGPIDIWHVTYPENLTVPEEYYGIRYPDPTLKIAR